MPDRPLAQIEQENAAHWQRCIAVIRKEHAKEVAELRARLAVLEAREEALRKLEAMWLRAADGGMKAVISLERQEANEAAAYERGKADARRFCAESIAALLAPSSPADTET